MKDSNKRLFLIVLVGVAAIAAALLLYEPSAPTPAAVRDSSLPTATSLPVGNRGPSVINMTTPMMPQGTSTVGQVTRDIFAPPAEYATLLVVPSNNPPNGASPTRGVQTFSAGPLPKLTGVIVGEGSRVAILRQGTISRSYRVGESTGSYRVASIGGNSVTLEGPTGTKVLTMGQ